MINTPPPFKGLKSRIPIIIPIDGRGLIIRDLGYRKSETFEGRASFRV